ncbi:PAS domain-containing sensor histidine kinase [Microbacterium sp.]|uniref:sensor histidine kinase n=1 Tax=Microbacterium sp. TaxID=51671 RepID=UPI002811792D|nr:PAS domain-containing sensor histidine kinase [Microbacterium sp.]
MTADTPSPRDPSRERTVILNQLLLGLVTLFAAGLVVSSGSYRDLGALAVGVAIVLLTSAFTVVVRWDRLPNWVPAIVPLADIAGITVLQLGHPTSGLGLLWMFPVLWVALNYGIVLTIALCAAVTITYWQILGHTSLGFDTRGALLPLTIVALAMFGHILSRRSGAQRALLARQSLTLRAAFERARTQEALVSEVLHSVDFGVMRIGSDGQVAVTNPAHTRLYGDPDAPLFRADGVTSLPPEERPLARARRGETFENLDLWHGGLGTGRRALQVSARRIRADGDSGVVLVSRDVTAERTALRARDDLVASVSHELRTPLTSIMGYLDLALDDRELAPSARRNLEVAERNAQRLLALVGDILSASADPDADLDARLRLAPTDIAALVRHAVEAAAPRAAERRILIDTEGVEPTTAHADASRIGQVVDNLLSNAIKYAHQDGNVWIGCANDGDRAIIAVRDDGPGIAPAEQGQLFERFYRADAVRRSSVHGSGLGLAISRDIVRAHGGDIHVQSAVGEGAAFVVTLPAGAPAPATEPATAPGSSRGPEEER